MDNQKLNLVATTPVVKEKVTLTISGILADLENGLTRTPSGKGYNAEIGCIQDKYSLTEFDVNILFKHDKLKGRKTHKKQTVSFVLVDDTPNEVVLEVTTPVVTQPQSILD